MHSLKKTSWIFIVYIMFLQQAGAEMAPDVKAQLNAEKHIALNITLPPKGFAFALTSGITEALPYVPVGETLEQYTQKIDLRTFDSPQTKSMDVIRDGLREYYLTQCPSLAYITTDAKTQKSRLHQEKGKGTIIEEKISNLEGYDLFEYGLTCKFHNFEKQLYARAYIGPSGAFEIVYVTDSVKQEKKEDLQEMKLFVDSFAIIDKK